MTCNEIHPNWPIQNQEVHRRVVGPSSGRCEILLSKGGLVGKRCYLRFLFSSVCGVQLLALDQDVYAVSKSTGQSSQFILSMQSAKMLDYPVILMCERCSFLLTTSSCPLDWTRQRLRSTIGTAHQSVSDQGHDRDDEEDGDCDHDGNYDGILVSITITISTRVPLQGALTDFQHLLFFPAYILHCI